MSPAHYYAGVTGNRWPALTPEVTCTPTVQSQGDRIGHDTWAVHSPPITSTRQFLLIAKLTRNNSNNGHIEMCSNMKGGGSGACGRACVRAMVGQVEHLANFCASESFIHKTENERKAKPSHAPRNHKIRAQRWTVLLSLANISKYVTSRHVHDENVFVFVRIWNLFRYCRILFLFVLFSLKHKFSTFFKLNKYSFKKCIKK